MKYFIYICMQTVFGTKENMVFFISFFKEKYVLELFDKNSLRIELTWHSRASNEHFV